MQQVIVYPQPSGVFAVVYPTQECLADNSLLAIAEASVPEGVPFKFVNLSEIPADRAARSVWSVDMAAPDGFGALQIS